MSTSLPALASVSRSPEIPASEDVYGWLVGSWTLRPLHYAGLDVSSLDLVGEAHFHWALEGRAIQDVWIMPRRAARTPTLPATNNMYGTTLRVWDPSLRAWRITWINPVTGLRQEQIGRRADGVPTRWRFTEITPNSFHWIGESLTPDGVTWRLEGEFLATRIEEPRS